MNTTKKPKREAWQGECAECLSDNLDYGVLEVDDDQVMYPYHCRDCGHDGEERYSLSHVEQT